MTPGSDPKMLDFINNELRQARADAGEARAWLEQGNDMTTLLIVEGKMGNAIHHIGRAQHPVADMTSPLHAGFQVWFGPETGPAAVALGLVHHFGEGRELYDSMQGAPAQLVKYVMDKELDEILKE